ncbi:hypothetical protein L484_004703 [Morus notabilis]|uniref:Uncharacterized protein n=1 Tax=Morus notabilis TaxID=981085 RepID=W9SXV4_9ROSA|nr:hypothetical protein L484_004703 [Morus notabilis]
MGSSATLNMASLIKSTHVSSSNCNFNGEINYGFHVKGTKSLTKLSAFSPNGSVSRSCSNGATSSVGDAHRRRSSLESLFCYDKAVPEERIEKPVGIYLAEKLIGDNPRCNDCHAKGAVLCSTCSGSGLYVDSNIGEPGDYC